jgi:hypothetical protein
MDAAGDPVLTRELVWVTQEGIATVVDPAWARSYGHPVENLPAVLGTRVAPR